jgi:hypothetical protein
MTRILRTLLGLICGYGLMIVLITLVQETWFGGVGWHETPLAKLALAGFLTCVAAAVGAVAATAIAWHTGRIAAAIMACLIVVETTALIVTGRTSGPLWFDAVAASSLIVAILLGAELFMRYVKIPRTQTIGA